MSRVFSLSQLSPSGLPSSPVRILTRSCPQDNAAPSSLEAEPPPPTLASTVSSPPQPLPSPMPTTAEVSAPDEHPPTVNGVPPSHSQDGDCLPGERANIHSCNINSNVNCKCGTTTDDGSGMVQCESCGVWSHLHCAGLTARSAKKAAFKCDLCNPPLQKKSTQRALNTKSVKHPRTSRRPAPPMPPPLLPPLIPTPPLLPHQSPLLSPRLSPVVPVQVRAILQL